MPTTATPVKKSDVKGIIIDKVIKLIEEKQTIPWVKPWYCPDSMNILSGHKYRGINIFITSFATSPYFVGQADLKKYGMKPKEGSHGYPVVYYKPLIYLDGKKIKEDTYKRMSEAQRKRCKYIPMLRYYSSFSVDDIVSETLPECLLKRIEKFAPPENHHARIDHAEAMIKKHNPDITFGGGRACYFPAKDSINMPKLDQFNTPEAYYCTMFHELSHWTGHGSRLSRPGVTNFDMFGSHKYSAEELIAELSAGQLCRDMEIEFSIDNSTAYVANWIKSLKNNPDMLFEASKQADQVIEYLNK